MGERFKDYSATGEVLATGSRQRKPRLRQTIKSIPLLRDFASVGLGCLSLFTGAWLFSQMLAAVSSATGDRGWVGLEESSAGWVANTLELLLPAKLSFEP